MTMRRRAETEARAQGFDAKLEAGFDWLATRLRTVLILSGGLVLAGALAAGLYEYRERSEESAQTELAQVETRFATAMGSDPDAIWITEPANPDVAQEAREQAVAGLTALIEDYARTRAAQIAALRAAEIEVDLDRLEPAQARLEQLTEDLSERDPLRGIALRLLGYAYEQRQQYAQAAESYAEAARSGRYPAGGALWIAAGGNFERAGAIDRALDAFREAVSQDPEFAEQEGLLERLSALSASVRN